jgi:peroxiredoxin
MDKKIITGIIFSSIIVLGAIMVFANPFGKRESSVVSQSSMSGSGSEVGQTIADFELESFDGKIIKLSSFKDVPILIDFWAGWCLFCVEEMPEIEKIHQEFGDGLIVLGIHRSETEGIDTGSKFAKERGVTYSLLKDSEGQIYKALTGGRQFMPYALYIDKDGKIAKVKAGPKTAGEIRTAVEELLK